MFLEISQNSQENTWARIPFLIKLQAWSANCTSHFGPPYSFVNFKVYLVVAFFERSSLTLGQFSGVISDLYKSGLYITPYFGHGQYSIWEFLVLAFLKTANLATIYFLAIFPDLEMTEFWSVNYIFLVYKLN